jgi:archaellum component FlaG (FlaF/FlaG flagellin family)
MAGSTVPSLIFFIGSIVVVSAFVGMANNSIAASGSLISSGGDDLAKQLRSSFEIIHVNASSNIAIYALNTGAASYGLAEVKAMIDGEWIPGTIVVVKGNSDSLWEPGEVVRITNTTNNLAQGWHEARLLVQGKVWSSSYSFKG